MNSYLAGALVEVNVQFIDQITQTNADPSVITLSVGINNASSSVSTYTSGTLAGPYTIVKDGVGLYHANLDTTSKPGNWWYEWSGTGTVQAISAAGFTVTKPPV
jgi:hypothetical protein